MFYPHGIKKDLKGTFKLCLPNFFSPKINQNRVANNGFDPQNGFNEERLSFPVYG
jgi:hypothetical protein